MAQLVKDPVLSLLQLRSLLWCGFHPLLGNFWMPWVQPKKKEKKKKKKTFVTPIACRRMCLSVKNFYRREVSDLISSREP